MSEIKSKEISVTDFIGEKVQFDPDGGYFFGVKNGELQMIAEVRGWGAIQNLFPGKTLEAAKFQDELGEWIADAINKKLQFSSQPGAAVFVKEEIIKRIHEMKEAPLFSTIGYNDRINELESLLKFIEEQPSPTEIVLPGWIDVKDKLPDHGHYIVTYFNPSYDNYLYTITAWRGRNGWYWDNAEKEKAESDTLKITHWMPLPEPPNSLNKKK